MRELKIDLTKGIKQLEIITKGLITTSLVGQYKSVFKGKGLEFAVYIGIEAPAEAFIAKDNYYPYHLNRTGFFQKRMRLKIYVLRHIEKQASNALEVVPGC